MSGCLVQTSEPVQKSDAVLRPYFLDFIKINSNHFFSFKLKKLTWFFAFIQTGSASIFKKKINNYIIAFSKNKILTFIPPFNIQFRF